jgi:hypothetical protein
MGRGREPSRKPDGYTSKWKTVNKCVKSERDSLVIRRDQSLWVLDDSRRSSR